MSSGRQNGFRGRVFLLAFCLAGCCISLRATHIVGGDLTYRHIGGDTFDITLVLYIDCVNGNPGAIQQDSNAMIGIFDSSGSFIKSLLEYRTPPIRINSVNYNCVSPPSNACVDKYIYSYRTTLPFLQGGYVLAFQRCCRNHSINNIHNPGNTGATYWTYVPDTAWGMGVNNAAVFKSLPPNFLCRGRNFVYDHSADDADGDSLVYELYTPFIGADPTFNRPRPPAGPPYSRVLWIPGFNADSMMHGVPELQINSKTGVLSVNPDALGQFVVGIGVKEFRNGKLINTTRRDFQFNVLNCAINVVSAFTQNIQTCSDTVSFSNSSVGADLYLWDFGDTLSSSDTSSALAPRYVYPGQGSYIAKLKVSKGNCEDSTSATVTILKDTKRFAGPDPKLCLGQSVKLGTTDTGSFSYTWTPSLYLDSPNVAHPVSTPIQSITYYVSRSYDICHNDDTVTVWVDPLIAGFTSHFVSGCNDATLALDSPMNSTDMKWFVDDSETAFNELVKQKFSFGKNYKVKLFVKDTLCEDTVEQWLIPLQQDSIELIPNVFTPNNDNLNDCFWVKSISLGKDCGHLIIYNRWGQLMFDSDTDGACWNGKTGEAEASEGVYYYILKYHEQYYHGTLTLKR